MTRPATRNKNKRHRSEDSDDPNLGILRKYYITEEISQTDIDKLYLVTKPACHGCRVNTKDSPNCFCGFVPASTGTRKTGLWQKLSEIVRSLGDNPYKLRSSTDTPAGLTNLGATCYANSILQCLYMNSTFRAGIFSVELDVLKQYPVLDQLARLFGQLHSSRMACIDSDPFIQTLELDNAVQQDSHEFLTLLLSLLERSLRHSKVSNARTMVQDLFRGSVSHVTRCSVCGKDSEASSKIEDFYGLELNINGLNSLDESLDDYLNVEELHGQNQYFCESCCSRVDATHCIKLCSLPVVLNFQLKRYIFVPKTMTKKKIHSAYHFPRRLNMKKRLSNPSESGCLYDLSAILIHKGSAANSGHYVAHIKDVDSGQWWEFDDEHVSHLGSHPFGEVLNPSSKAQEVRKVHEAATCHSVSNGNHFDVPQGPGPGDDDSYTEIYSSSDAYMLMYTRVNDMVFRQSIDMDAKKSNLPHFSEELQALNASYLRACEDHKLKKDRQVAYITERREEVKLVLSEAPVRTLGEPYFWVSAEWLRQWADSLTPLCIDNRPILCVHQKVPFSKVRSMKRLSVKAWMKLLKKYGGGPSLSGDDYCIDCIKEGAKAAVSADDYRDKSSSLRPLAEAALAGECPEGTSYYVSKSWLVQWLRKETAEVSSEADSGPTVSLRCPHGGLLPEQAAGARRVLIPEKLWLFFCESYNLVKHCDMLGSSSFPSDCEPCELCNMQLQQTACMNDKLRAAKLQQKLNHEKLIQAKSFELLTDCKYYLVPSAWLNKWRAYLTSTAKSMLTSAEPESLQVAIESLICQKHARLLERPLELLYKRGTITQKLSKTEGLTIIPEIDWNLFCSEWNVKDKKGIQAEILAPKQMPVFDTDKKVSPDEPNDDFDSVKLTIKTYPEICEECIGERETCELIRKLSYCDEDICVYLVRGKEAPRSIIEASTAKLEAGEGRRTSKRSKKASFGNSVNLKVSGATSIHQLKMMLWEAFGVVKENQKLYKGSVEIDGDVATLADKSIYPGDVLWVKDSEIHEYRDIADELSTEKVLQRSVEEGFRGSRLTSENVNAELA